MLARCFFVALVLCPSTTMGFTSSSRCRRVGLGRDPWTPPLPHRLLRGRGRALNGGPGVVIEFDMPPPPPKDPDELAYTLGLNMAKQLPPDLKNLLSEDELATCMRGLTDMMLGRAIDADAQLRENGDQLNQLLQQRAREQQETAAAAGAELLAAAAAEEGAETTPGGVVVKMIESGVGPFPTAASTVEVHYEGRLADGTVFDSSYSRGETTKFPLNGVIVGWQEGLQKMQEGSSALLTIPSDLGYGAQGAPQGGIPGGATLIFKVELVKVLSGGVGGLVV